MSQTIEPGSTWTCDTLQGPETVLFADDETVITINLNKRVSKFSPQVLLRHFQPVAAPDAAAAIRAAKETGDG